ncbi:unnamed protein product [Vitrella brassicaformis CCMP3155]|uniref:BTB domain-containing protein n=1 Tax=Vitrella brassicaformis (strain CCMP3155) TaxID=1169540 RepID=A0A0G4G143_VITBC|nr:unnamed protein product [Vitrella brassicaformis CCMP3155]|eukprot:CEM21201.1 unnamed protein product [Vitrella brassicaformis CCMP3155]
MVAEVSLVKIVNLLVKHSSYFAAALDGSGFAENATQSVEVPSIRPETFKNMSWLLPSGDMCSPQVLKAHIAGMTDLPCALDVPTDGTHVDESDQGDGKEERTATGEGPPQNGQQTDGSMVYSSLPHLLVMCQYFNMEAHVAYIAVFVRRKLVDRCRRL